MGGNVFARTESIEQKDIGPTLTAYYAELKKVFPSINPEKDFVTTGSVGKKLTASGDIDFAMEQSAFEGISFNNEELTELAEKFFKRMRGITDENRDQKQSESILKAQLTIIAETLNASNVDIEVDIKKVGVGSMFSAFPQYDENGITDKYVQIDWMVGKKDLLEFAYWSADYSQRTDGTKGLHRTQLMLAMFNAIGYTFSHTKGLQKQGENGYNNDMGFIISTLQEYYEGVDFEALKTYESIYAIAKKSKYFQKITDVYLGILDSTKADIPDEFKKAWLEHSVYCANNECTYNGDIIKSNVSDMQKKYLTFDDKEYKAKMKFLATATGERKAYTGKFLPESSKLYKIIN
jgi:hypothetical protein